MVLYEAFRLVAQKALSNSTLSSIIELPKPKPIQIPAPLLSGDYRSRRKQFKKFTENQRKLLSQHCFTDKMKNPASSKLGFDEKAMINLIDDLEESRAKATRLV
jgi:hypothetical protein